MKDAKNMSAGKQIQVVAARRAAVIAMGVLVMGLSASAAAVTSATTPTATTSSPVAKKAAPTNPQVSVKTSMGEIVIELYPEKAPITVKNF